MASDERLVEVRRRFAAETARRAERSGFRDPRVEAAFAAVPRERCLTPPPWRIFAPGGLCAETTSDPTKLYDDVLVALDRWRGINNGQPSLHAAWMMAVSPAAGETLVQIGAGSGYYTAILAELVGPGGHVDAYEIDRGLAARAAGNLTPWPQASLHGASGAGEVPRADVIYVAAGVAAPPAAWLSALLPGGRLIFPWQPKGAAGLTLLVRRVPAGFAAIPAFGVSFIPCVGTVSAGGRTRANPASARSIWRHADRLPDETAVVVDDDVWLSSAAPG